MNSLILSWKNFIAQGLNEDSAAFDWTSRAVNRAVAQSKKKVSSQRAALIAKSDGIWAADIGLEAIQLLSKEMGSPIEVRSLVKNGESLAPQTKICTWSGDPEALLTFERTFINLASYACGIATQTNHLVQKITAAGKKAKIKKLPRLVPTRKTLPGYRDLAIESTLIGGAHPHRLNLAGGLLIKENHISAAGGITTVIESAREVAPHGLKIEIEVRNLKELKEAIEACAEVILLDNFTPAQIEEAIRYKPKGMVLFEASGNINADNIESYVIDGLDVISVGSITHSVKAVDLSLLMNNLA